MHTRTHTPVFELHTPLADGARRLRLISKLSVARIRLHLLLRHSVLPPLWESESLLTRQSLLSNSDARKKLGRGRVGVPDEEARGGIGASDACKLLKGITLCGILPLKFGWNLCLEWRSKVEPRL